MLAREYFPAMRSSSASMAAMQTTLQDALDDLLSSRTSEATKTEALDILERIIALSCLRRESVYELSTFLALQDTFECNVPSRLLTWIASSIPKLEALTAKGSMDFERESQASVLSAQLSLSLFLIQGVVLHHAESKRCAERKYSLEILVDLLLSSRHVSSLPSKKTNTSSANPARTDGESEVSLSSVVLDTLLCILVDSPAALRVFEECDGVQAVVKILKRAGTPHEVRMKCLEFLYFYLLDETLPSPPDLTPPSTAPATPVRTSNTNHSSQSTLHSSSSSSSSSRASSWDSMSSFSSTSTSTTSYSIGTATTCNTSPSGSPSPSPCPLACPRDPPLGLTYQAQSRALLMLRKEVDYVPLSPKKAQTSRLVVGRGTRPSLPKRKAAGLRSSLFSSGSESSGVGSEDETHVASESSQETWTMIEEELDSDQEGMVRKNRARTRTTEEKKEILGGMLGNVDALVEGVRKAGIWGLG